MSELTNILQTMELGEPQAADQLLPMVYDELKRMASAQMAREKPGQTLQATALVHEAWLRLNGASPRDHPSLPAPLPMVEKGDISPQLPEGERVERRRYFFAAAAEAMRRILIEQARAKGRLKRGGVGQRVALSDVADTGTSVDEIIDLDSALTALALVDPVKAELIKLRYFAGLDESEAAECLGISRATASRYWAFARAWMFDYLQSERNSRQS